MRRASWIAVDWGTSRLRLWALDDADCVIGEVNSQQGMGGLAPDAFEGVLLAHAQPYLPGTGKTPVLICGMAGARQGWVEAPYATVPCAPVAMQFARPKVTDPRLDVRILPGLCQLNPADVMRGEETQIAGVLTQQPEFAGSLCLPGTHCKWVQIDRGQVTAFATAMTGELFDLLAHKSILRHSMTEVWDDDVFLKAVDLAMARPEAVFCQLFPLRAQSLIGEIDATAPRAYLSGLLIGAELMSMRAHWDDRPVTVIGAPALSRGYQMALARFGAEVKVADGGDLALAGLTYAHAQLEENQ